MLKAKDFSDSDLKLLSVGIHTNLRLKEVVSGDNYIDVTYSSDENEIHRERIFEPNISKVYTRQDETREEAYERDKTDTLRRISNLLKIFLSKADYETFQAPTVNEFFNTAVLALNKFKDSARVNLKLVPDSKLDFPEAPKYSRYVEVYEEGKESKLKFSSWEIANRVKPYKDKSDTSSPSSKESDLDELI